MDIILKYFPDITSSQREAFVRLESLYGEWNSRINVISRKDAPELYERHVLHSLAIAGVCRLDDGAEVLDVGTGGGFPGIPLAILFPRANFTLVDSIAKKCAVAEAVAGSLGLTNVRVVRARAEQLPGKFDYVVSRAVTDMSTFIGWVWNKLRRGQAGTLPNGILYLKGGDLTQELAAAGKEFVIYPIGEMFEEEFFQTKKVVYLRR